MSTDSRRKMTTQLFIPLIGETNDGHHFLADAIANGAKGFLTEREDVPSNAAFAVWVEDTTRALGDLARYVLHASGATVIAVTGSVGKTTTRQFIASVVSQAGKTVATKGNFNNHIGLPLTILGMDGDEKYAVLEMGMNHFGEISYLSRIAQPDMAVITMIGTSHIEYLGSRENILKAKCEIVDGMKADGILVLNGDDDLLAHLDLRKNTHWFGKTKADFPYETVSFDGEFTVDGFHYHIPIPGAHNIQDAGAAVLIGKLIGLSPETIQAGLSRFTAEDWRQKIETVGSITLIADCYNASLDSIRAALAVLSHTEGNRKVAVLGPIGEIGNYAELILKEVGNAVRQEKIDCLICVEKESHWICEGAKEAGMAPDAVYFFPQREEFLSRMNKLLHPGDTVLFKASRKYRFEELYEAFRQTLQEN